MKTGRILILAMVLALALASPARAEGRPCPDCGRNTLLMRCTGDWADVYFSYHICEPDTAVIRISRYIQELFFSEEFRALFPEEAFVEPPLETLPADAIVCYYMVQFDRSEEYCTHCGRRRYAGRHIHSEYHDACGVIYKCPYQENQEVRYDN